MKLKIFNEEYTLNWGLGAFAIVEEELELTIDEIISRFSEHKVNIALTYASIKNAYRIEKDDDFAELPFGKTKFASWIESEPQETADNILKSFLQWTTHGKSWAEKLQIDIEKIFPSSEEPVVKKKVSKRTPK